MRIANIHFLKDIEFSKCHYLATLNVIFPTVFGTWIHFRSLRPAPPRPEDRRQ